MSMMWVGIGSLGSAAIGYLGQQSANKSAEKIANTPQTSASSNESQSSFVPNPMANPLYEYIGGLAQQMGATPTPYFPGQTYVGPSAPTQLGTALEMGMVPFGLQAAQRVYGGADASQGGYGAANGLFGQAAGMAPGVSNAFNNAAGAYGMGAGAQAGMLPGANSNFAFLSNAANVAENPYVNAQADAMTRRLNQNFREQLLPSINQGANQVNALGSSRHALAQAQGSERTQEQLARGLADLYGGAYQSGLGAQQTALGQTGAMLRNQLAPADALGQAARERQMGMDVFGRGGQYLQQGAQGLQQGQQDYANNVLNAWNAAQGSLGNLYSAGGRVEDYQQRALQDAIGRFTHRYAEPWDRLGMLGSAAQFLSPLGTNYSNSAGTGAASGPAAATSSPWLAAGQGAIGGGMLGMGLRNMYNDYYGNNSNIGGDYGAHAGVLGRTQYNF
jgi:hypothetical protein